MTNDKEIVDDVRKALKILNDALDVASAMNIEIGFLQSQIIGRLNEYWYIGRAERRTPIL